VAANAVLVDIEKLVREATAKYNTFLQELELLLLPLEKDDVSLWPTDKHRAG